MSNITAALDFVQNKVSWKCILHNYAPLYQ